MKKVAHTTKLSLNVQNATKTITKKFASAQNFCHHQDNCEFLARLFSLLPPSSVKNFYCYLLTKI